MRREVRSHAGLANKRMGKTLIGVLTSMALQHCSGATSANLTLLVGTTAVVSSPVSRARPSMTDTPAVYEDKAPR